MLMSTLNNNRVVGYEHYAAMKHTEMRAIGKATELAKEIYEDPLTYNQQQ